MNIISKIVTIIRANRSIIALKTVEEYRALQCLIGVCQQDELRVNGQSPKLISWGCFLGFQLHHPSSAELPPELVGKPIIDPTKAIECLMAFNRQESVIFVFKGIHAFYNNPRVLRGLLDLSHSLNQTDHFLVILSPMLQMPPELESHVSVVDFPLPTETELNQILTKVVRSTDKITDKMTPDDRRALIQALQGLTLDDAMGALKQSIIESKGVLNGRTLKAILQEKEQLVRKSGVLEYFHSQNDYEDVGGLDNLKQYLREAEMSFTPQAKEYGVEPARGILVAGIPGTGKSLVSKACAGGRHPKPLIKMSIGELLAAGGGIVGQGQAKLGQALKTIEAIGQCVVWVDEVEKAFGRGGGELDGGSRRDMLGWFLTWMQESNAPAFIVATANDAAMLPPELVRRFDEKFFVDLPGPRARLEIFRIHLSKRKRNPDEYQLPKLVAQTKGYTGGEIEQVIKRGLRKAMLEAGPLTNDHLLESIREIKPISKTMHQQLEYYRQWDGRPADSSDPEESADSDDFLGLKL